MKIVAHPETGNSLAAFDAALALGVDMVELDVLPERRDGSGALLLAHDPSDLRARHGDLLTLEAALDHLAQERWSQVGLNVDLKVAGAEARVARALAERDLSRRALVSSMHPRSLRHVRAADPVLRLGLSVPRARRDYLANRWTRVPAQAAVLGARWVLPPWLVGAIRRGAIDAVMAHWSLATPRFVTPILAAGAELYVWTVDDAERIERLRALGVTGVISNDPGLLAGRR